MHAAPSIDPLLSMAVILLAGAFAGALFKKMHLPSVTGQILVGVLIGPAVLGLFGKQTIQQLHPITDFALSLIAVTVGTHLQFRKLRNAARRLLATAIAEVMITPLMVFTALYALTDVDWTVAVLLATLSIASAPATILSIIKDTHSKGVFVKTLIGAVALTDMACIFLFELAHTITRLHIGKEYAFTLANTVFAPMQELLLAGLLGVACGVVLVIVTKPIIKPDKLTTASFVAILVTAGAAHHFHLSSILACMFLGITIANIIPDREYIGHAAFENFESAIFAVFFTLAGMHLDFQYLIPAFVPVLIVFLSRGVGKVCAANVAMRVAGATKKLQNNLGAALIPQAGVAVGLILLIRQDPALVPIRDLLLAIGITVLALNEVIGPLITRAALVRSGDYQKDHPRLIDFIHEENIVIDFEAHTKESAIEQLVDLLIKTNNLEIDRDALVKSVLDHESEMPTFIGGGLAVPHGLLEQGEELKGVMAISRKGLKLDTPDGNPLHCMVLVATPESLRDRYLEVFAALARTIVFARSIQVQLFNATSAAHAYELLHAEEAENFNYFLKDEVTSV